VTFLNYVNPMVMNCWAIARASKIHTVGLCHSVPLTAMDLAHDVGVPPAQVDYLVAGINHMAFFLKLEHNGQDLYPRLREFMQSDKFPPKRGRMTDHVRYEMFKRLGYFVTESSEHFSEYVPWFIKTAHPELIEQFDIPLDEYIRRCEENIAQWQTTQREMENPDIPVHVERSVEYGSYIINAKVTGEPARIYGNMPNHGIIDNLPQGVPVEVPCLVDRNGVQPVHIGALPPHLAALMQTNINVQALTVEAALTRKREYIYHAAMLDPHTAAELTLDEIWALVDELIAAHGSWLPEYH
jgi:alpha-galactosidase